MQFAAGNCNKQLTTSLLHCPDFDDVWKMIKIMPAESTHKYIGPNLTAIIAGSLEHILLNNHIFLNFAVTFSGLATLPLTKVCLRKLGIVHIRIFRSKLGWAQCRVLPGQLERHTPPKSPRKPEARTCLEINIATTLNINHRPVGQMRPRRTN